MVVVGGLIDLVVNGGLGLLVGIALLGPSPEAVLLAGLIYISSSGIVTRALFDLRRLGRRRDRPGARRPGVRGPRHRALPRRRRRAGERRVGGRARDRRHGRHRARRSCSPSCWSGDGPTTRSTGSARASTGSSSCWGRWPSPSGARPWGRRRACRRRSGRCWPASCCRAARCATRSSSSSWGCATSRPRSSSSRSASRWTWARRATSRSGCCWRCRSRWRRSSSAATLPGGPRASPRARASTWGRPSWPAGSSRSSSPSLAAGGVALDADFRDLVGPFAGLFVLATAVAGVVLMRESRRIGRLAFPFARRAER